MTLTKKIAATAAAATAIVTGSYLALTNTSSDNQEVFVPKIPVAKIHKPDIPIAKVFVPIINKADITQADFKTVQVSKAAVSKTYIPTSGIMYTAISSAVNIYTYVPIDVIEDICINTATVNDSIDYSVYGTIFSNYKAIYKPAITLKNILTVNDSVDYNFDVTVPGNYKAIYKPTITLKTISTASDGINKSIDFFKKFNKYFKDKSLTQHTSSNINRHNSDIHAWLNISDAVKDYTQTFVPLTTGIKAIAEIHHPIDPVILNDNLEWYSSKGYNAALITFGYNDENIVELCNVAKLIKSKNMKVLIAYAGPETQNHNILISPDTLKYKITALSKISDALILGWRRTSLHLYTQDTIFTNFIIKSARESNSNIAVIGEAFFGELNNKGLEKSFGIGYNIPNNSSAVLITGLGYNRVAVESVLNNLLADIKDYNRLVLIGGDKPYYDTRLNTNKSFEYNFNIKEGLIKRWLKAGVGGAIVLHGDGSDGRYDENITDNLAITKYN